MKTSLPALTAKRKQTKNRLLFSLFFLLFLNLLAFNSNSQVLISPTGDGGFENGTTMAANGWIEVQAGGAAANKWYVGAVVKTAGIRGVYVDNNGGTSNTYNTNVARTQYFYKDVSFPAGATNINLSFKWKCYGENAAGADSYDFLRVFLVPTTTTPAAGTLLPTANIIGIGKYNLQNTTQTASITLPNGLAGTTMRLAFCWNNDDFLGTQPPASIDEISLTYTPPVPPTGINFTPATGCANTTSITITGTNLGSATAVKIGGTAVASITSNTSTQIIAVIGAGTSGTVSVTTAGGTGTSAGNFTVNPLPLAYNVTGGGAYCSGGSGQSIGLSNSATGIDYQLYNGASPVGSSWAGTGAALDFGLNTASGTYTVVAANSATGCSKTQNGSAVIIINTPASISSNPSSATKCAGQSVSFSVTASGSSPSYQWRKDGINIGGATAATYTIPSVAAADAASYDVVVTVASCGSTSSSAATLIVNPLPVIYAVTGGGVSCVPGPGLPVGLTGSQVGVNYTLFPGAIIVAGTGAAISFGNQTTAATYTVSAQNTTSTCSVAMSGNAVITSKNSASIISDPASAVKCAGSSVSFSVTASGSTPTYQWRKNGTNIVGATAATYTIPSVAVADAASYDVVVTVAPCGSVTSLAATLTVNPSPVVYAVTGGGIYCTGGSGLPVGLTGSDVGINYTLSPGAVVVAGTGSAISFGNQTAAATYSVSAQNPSTTCSVTMSGNAVISVTAPITISTQPTDKTVCAGVSASFSVVASGGSLSYQWRKGLTVLNNGGSVSGATTATLTINPVTAGDAATDYNCNITNSCQTVTSGYASLTVNTAAVAPTAQPTVLIFPTVSITSIVGSFTLTSSATNYLVVRRNTATTPAAPSNGTNYPIGSAALGAGTYVEYTGTSNVFTSNGLNPGTTYYYWVYAFNISSCGTSPLYFTAGPLTGSVTTATNVNCGTVTPFYWAGTGSTFSNPSKTSNFNTASNWSLSTPAYSASPVSPTECNDVYISPNNNVIITLSADAAVYNMNFTVSGGSDAYLSAEGKILEINGNALIDVNSASTTVGIGENSAAAGIVDFKANVNIGINPGGASRASYFLGNSSSKLIFRGDLTLGRTCAIPTNKRPGTVLFDGDGLQQILWNNNIYFANFSNVVIGSANNPVVRHVTGTYTPDNILGNLTINGSSTLDLATSQWIRDNAGGSFIMNGTSKLLLANDNSIPSPASGNGIVIPGSNFPGGFSTVTLSPNSTVEYNGPNTLTQTVYAAPAYGFLTLTNGTGSGVANKISTAVVTATNKVNVNNGVTMTMGAGMVSNNDFYVNSGGILQCATYPVSGTGSFNLLAGGTLGMASPQGITLSGATGNIRTNTRVFNTAANYIYNGTGALQTGNALPTLVNDLTISNSSGITLYAASANYTVAGTLRQTAGPFILNGNTLTINSLIRSSGTFTGSAASGITVKGTNIPLFFTAGGAILKDLAINTGASANLGTSLDITAGSAAGSVAVGSGATLTTNNNLALKSDALGTARIAEIPVNGSGAALGFITGNVTVERYISAQRAWRFLAIPTAGSQSINASWQEGQPQGNNTLAGKGIQITGSTFPSNGFDAYSATPSVKTWSAGAYTGISGTNIPIATDNGYMTFIRGDRTINYYTTAVPPATVLRTSGTLKTGKYPSSAISLATGVFTAVGNPYASAIDFNKVTRTGGAPNTFYVWDPKLTTGPNSAYGLGGFRAITWDNMSSSYIVTPAGGSYSSGNTDIESGEAFFTVAPISAGTLSFPEACKQTTSHLVARQGGISAPQLRTNIYVISSGNPILIDGTLVQFNAAYSNDIDELDVIKFANSGENLGLKRNGQLYTVERRAEVVSRDTLFYNLGQIRQQQYEFEFIADNLAVPGLQSFLEDNYLHNTRSVSLTDTTTVLFSIVGTDPGSYAADRFRVVFTRPLAPVPVTITQISATRTSENNIAVSWKVENELNIKNYELERSGDGRSFGKINTSSPKLNNGGAASYDYLDESPLATDNFYRIRSNGLDGQVHYSSIVKIARETTTAYISIYPNPVADKKLAIAFSDQPAGEYKIRLSNLLGQVISTYKVNVIGSNMVKTISLEEWIAAGNYQLSIIAEDGTKRTEQLVVQ